ncbi:MAG TPA: biotin--[acetyl-CoA-carboxylase] ligase [Solirubrobacterales bacterium]|jgi:BirA family biotin operon repressor/biotin-[acetyl-CoA-carboxylase] ligase
MEALLRGGRKGLGTPHRHYRSTDSTNTRARELAAAGATHGTVVTADEQTAGRGRQGRSWTAPAGKALLYSAILRPLDRRHLLLPLAVPLAVCEGAEELESGLECRIKWPNDVWVGESKLAGVLIEAKPQDGWAVIGVGLNLAILPHEFPSELREKATSLSGDASPEQARHALDRSLDRWVEADAGAILAAWRSRDALKGRGVSWNEGTGVAEGISDAGDLLVLSASGERVVLGAGEVHLRV